MQPTNLEQTPLERRQNLEQKRNGPTPSKLPGTTIALMLCTTIALDVAEFLLDAIVIGVVLNIIIDFCVELGFYVWFKTRGMNMAKARKAITFLGGGAVELFFDGAIPLWTLDITLIILLERAEEYAAKHSKMLNAAAGVAQKYARVKGNASVAKAAGGVKKFTKKAQEDQSETKNKYDLSKPPRSMQLQKEKDKFLGDRRGGYREDPGNTKGLQHITPATIGALKDDANNSTDPVRTEEERRKKAREERISKLNDVRGKNK